MGFFFIIHNAHTKLSIQEILNSVLIIKFLLKKVLNVLDYLWTDSLEIIISQIERYASMSMTLLYLSLLIS